MNCSRLRWLLHSGTTYRILLLMHGHKYTKIRAFWKFSTASSCRIFTFDMDMLEKKAQEDAAVMNALETNAPCAVWGCARLKVLCMPPRKCRNIVASACNVALQHPLLGISRTARKHCISHWLTAMADIFLSSALACLSMAPSRNDLGRPFKFQGQYS